MTAACAIRVERVEDGRYRAHCSLLPGVEMTADTEEAARRGMEEAIGRYLAEQLPGADAPEHRSAESVT